MISILNILLGCMIGVGLFAVVFAVNNSISLYKNRIEERFDFIEKRHNEVPRFFISRIDRISEEVKKGE